jgi:hypothetical protein
MSDLPVEVLTAAGTRRVLDAVAVMQMRRDGMSFADIARTLHIAPSHAKALHLSALSTLATPETERESRALMLDRADQMLFQLNAVQNTIMKRVEEELVEDGFNKTVRSLLADATAIMKQKKDLLEFLARLQGNVAPAAVKVDAYDELLASLGSMGDLPTGGGEEQPVHEQSAQQETPSFVRP